MCTKNQLEELHDRIKLLKTARSINEKSIVKINLAKEELQFA